MFNDPKQSMDNGMMPGDNLTEFATRKLVAIAFGKLEVGEVFYTSLKSTTKGVVIKPVLNSRLDDKSLLILKEKDPEKFPSENPRDYPLNAYVVRSDEHDDHGRKMHYSYDDTVYIDKG